jgi:hypothetical protein
MRSVLTFAALAGVICGARHFLNFLSRKSKRRLARKKLEVWEGEGGAVPVARTRTAAQISPRKVSKASPRGVN